MEKAGCTGYKYQQKRIFYEYNCMYVTQSNTGEIKWELGAAITDHWLVCAGKVKKVAVWHLKLLIKKNCKSLNFGGL